MFVPPGQSRGHGRTRAAVMICLAATIGAAVVGCSGRRYDPSMATRHYPAELGQGEVLEIQAFREGPNLVIVNASLQNFENVDLWLNRRYMHHLNELPAGGTVTVNLNDFWDAWGETPIAGGFFRTDRATPSVLLQFQFDRNSPMAGAICIPATPSTF